MTPPTIDLNGLESDIRAKVLQELSASGLSEQLFVNQVYPPFFRGRDGESYRRWRSELEERPEAESGLQRGRAENEEAILACAESWKKARAAQDVHLGRLLSIFGDRTILLPSVAIPQASIDMIRALARSIEEPDETMKGSASAEPGS